MMAIEDSALFQKSLGFIESLLSDLREEIAVLVITAIQGTASVCADVCVQRLRAIHKQMAHEFLQQQLQQQQQQPKKASVQSQSCQTEPLPCALPAPSAPEEPFCGGVECALATVSEGSEEEEEEEPLQEALALELVQGEQSASEGGDDGEVPLVQAVRDHDLLQVQALLQAGTKPDVKTAAGEWLLREAVGLCDLDSVALLLGHGADAAPLQLEDDLNEELLGDARLLSAIVANKRVQCQAERLLLASLCHGVRAYVCARIGLTEELPCFRRSLPPAECLRSGEASMLMSSGSHRVAMHMPDSARPLLELSPLQEQARAVVILLHGQYQSAEMLENMARELASSLPHVRFLVPTVRPGKGLVKLEEGRAELLELLRQLPATPPRTVFAGLAEGGELACLAATRGTDRAAGLLLLGTSLDGVCFGGDGARGLPVLVCLPPGSQSADTASREASLRSLGCPVELAPSGESVQTWLARHLPAHLEGLAPPPEPSSATVPDMRQSGCTEVALDDSQSSDAAASEASAASSGSLPAMNSPREPDVSVPEPPLLQADAPPGDALERRAAAAKEAEAEPAAADESLAAGQQASQPAESAVAEMGAGQHAAVEGGLPAAEVASSPEVEPAPCGKAEAEKAEPVVPPEEPAALGVGNRLAATESSEADVLQRDPADAADDTAPRASEQASAEPPLQPLQSSCELSNEEGLPEVPVSPGQREEEVGPVTALDKEEVAALDKADQGSQVPEAQQQEQDIATLNGAHEAAEPDSMQGAVAEASLQEPAAVQEPLLQSLPHTAGAEPPSGPLTDGHGLPAGSGAAAAAALKQTEAEALSKTSEPQQNDEQGTEPAAAAEEETTVSEPAASMELPSPQCLQCKAEEEAAIRSDEVGSSAPRSPRGAGTAVTVSESSPSLEATNTEAGSQPPEAVSKTSEVSQHKEDRQDTEGSAQEVLASGVLQPEAVTPDAAVAEEPKGPSPASPSHTTEEQPATSSEAASQGPEVVAAAATAGNEEAGAPAVAGEGAPLPEGESPPLAAGSELSEAASNVAESPQPAQAGQAVVASSIDAAEQEVPMPAEREAQLDAGTESAASPQPSAQPETGEPLRSSEPAGTSEPPGTEQSTPEASARAGPEVRDPDAGAEAAAASPPEDGDASATPTPAKPPQESPAAGPAPPPPAPGGPQTAPPPASAQQRSAPEPSDVPAVNSAPEQQPPQSSPASEPSPDSLRVPRPLTAVTVVFAFEQAVEIAWWDLDVEGTVYSLDFEAPGLPRQRRTGLREARALLPHPADADSLWVRLEAQTPDGRPVQGPWIQVGVLAEELDTLLPHLDADPTHRRRGGCQRSGCKGYISPLSQDPFAPSEMAKRCARCGEPFEDHEDLGPAFEDYGDRPLETPASTASAARGEEVSEHASADAAKPDEATEPVVEQGASPEPAASGEAASERWEEDGENWSWGEEEWQQWQDGQEGQEPWWMQEATAWAEERRKTGSARASSSNEEPTWFPKQSNSEVWEVVGGVGWGKGGIVVRVGKDPTSPRLEERLGTGSLVRGLKLEGGRLHYELLMGRGPRRGWVTVGLKNGNNLLVRTKKLTWSSGFLTP